MAENLNYTPSSGNSWCYNNASGNCSTYGRLYDWTTANAVCPGGWHLPDSTEWHSLEVFVGSSQAATLLEASSALWSTNSGTDAFGFSALPGGMFSGYGGGSRFLQFLDQGFFWTSTNDGVGGGNALALGRVLNAGGGTIGDYHDAQIDGFSIRCVKTISSSSSSSQASSSSVSLKGQFTDSRDGQVYDSVRIGTQTWMATQLNYSGDNGVGGRTFNLGWCYGVGGSDTAQHQDDASCGGGYGRLYTWADVMGFSDAYLTTQTTAGMITTPHRGICPMGWHVPTDAEWQTLEVTMGMSMATTTQTGWRGTNEGTKLKSTNGWTSGAGVDSVGFTALPSGYRQISGNWWDRGYCTTFWSASESNGTIAWNRILYWDHVTVYRNNLDGKIQGYSLRCLKN